jgi:hypothetical protein
LSVVPFTRVRIRGSADQVRQDPAVFVVVNLFKSARAQLERLELAHFPVGPSLPLRRLNNNEPGFFTGLGIDFVKDLPFAARQ